MTWRQIYWSAIAACWVLIIASQAVLWSTRHAMRTASQTPPTIPCRQGMTLLPGQSCYMTMDILIPAGPRREETSY